MKMIATITRSGKDAYMDVFVTLLHLYKADDLDDLVSCTINMYPQYDLEMKVFSMLWEQNKYEAAILIWNHTLGNVVKFEIDNQEYSQPIK